MLQAQSVISISPVLAERLQAMPKVEIHVHLEGATDAETVRTISAVRETSKIAR